MRLNPVIRQLAALASGVVIVAAAPGPARTLEVPAVPGFAVLAGEDGAFPTLDTVVIEYAGPVAFPMAEGLLAIWQEIERHPRITKIVLRLDSPGGSYDHGRKVIEVLTEIRNRASLATLVGEGDVCASMCIALFVQGDTRYASPASAWMFHGASRFMSNVPSLAMTARYFDLFAERGIDARFIRHLHEQGYVTAPGAYWMSGRELAAESDIVTDLLPNWRPAAPRPGPLASGLLPGGV